MHIRVGEQTKIQYLVLVVIPQSDTLIINSFTWKANYYGTHDVQKKKCCALLENVVSKLLALYDQETTDQYVVDCKVLTV